MNQPLSRFLIPPTMTLKEAMKRLEETEERIVFVTSSTGELMGSLTDGDVRRWILAEGSLAAEVGGACHRTPYTVTGDVDLAQMRKVMVERRLTCVPVVDADGRIKDLLFWDSVFAESSPHASRQLTAPVVIMAGGKGTRMEPFTRILPKPLVPIGDRAVIEIIIDSFRRHGIGLYFLSVNHKARLIRSFFEELQPPYEIRYVEETEPRGTAGALYALRGQIEGSFFVTNCDVVVKIDFADLLDHHLREGNLVTLVASVKPFRIPYGVCDLKEGGRLAGIREKPEFEFLVNTGLYMLDASALELIPPTGMFHMTDLISAAQAAGRRVGVFPVGGDAWLDTGEWAEYRKTVEMLRVDRRKGARGEEVEQDDT
jgi:dTDP-glucose pyrophosphorylase